MQTEQLGIFNRPNDAPLAYRLRPNAFDDFKGQAKILKKIEDLDASHLPHIVLSGPPGCGKTTLAYLLADKVQGKLFSFNAVLSGVKELRSIIAEALELKQTQGINPVIFIDEIHRFNKAQQDALLPHLESGDFIFLGATTENPKITLNKAVISRVQLWYLAPLEHAELTQILQRSLIETGSEIPESVQKYLIENSNGDARVMLNQLEALIPHQGELKDLSFKEIREQYLQENRRYDKDSERHYDVISAFIKSVRGSDVEAALLWLAVMLDGGEDIEFIARRLIILASEDIGNADPRGLQVATSAHYGVKTIGMPEARIILAQATTYLTQAPKSNSSYTAINEALAFVASNPTIEVPTHLRNHHPDKKNYKYPHSFPNHWTEQRYTPLNKHFYNSSGHGYEKMQDDFQDKVRNKK